MATSTSNVPYDNSSLANFKAWAMAISAAFSAFGWTQTSDTGQVNWSSIASVPSSTFVYEMWKANDSLASTLPILVKVQYGFSSTIPRLSLTAGTASDGAGNLTGVVTGGGTAWQVTQSNTNNGSTLLPCYFSGDAGSFRAVMWENNVAGVAPGGMCIAFGVERSHGATGSDTGDYFTAWCVNNSSNPAHRQQTLTPTVAANTNNCLMSVTGNNSAATGLLGTTVACFPVFPVYGKVGNPLKDLMVVYSADVIDQSICTVNDMYGATHTYVAFGNSSNLSIGLGQRLTNGAVTSGLMRYE